MIHVRARRIRIIDFIGRNVDKLFINKFGYACWEENKDKHNIKDRYNSSEGCFVKERIIHMKANWFSK